MARQTEKNNSIIWEREELNSSKVRYLILELCCEWV